MVGWSTNTSNGSLRDIEFKDKLGRVVLTRRTDGSQDNDTAYYYDDKGRVTTVIPPGATLSDLGLIYQYVYDERDRIIKKKVPDQGWVYFKYDDRDLVTYTQDGNMRAAGRWTHSHYDDYGRMIESGFVNSDPVDGDEVKSFDLSLTRNCYDGCVFSGTAPQIYTGKIQRSETRVLGTNDWLSQTIFYDSYGRVERTEGNNILNLSNALAEDVNYTYDYADNILQQSRSHLGVESGLVSIKDFMTIDQAGRLATADQEIDGNRFKISDLVYTVKDQISAQYLGHSSGNWLQKIDFNYKPNRFLEAINDGNIYDSNLLGVDACTPQTPDGGNPQNSVNQNDLFTMNLYYDTQVGFQTSSLPQKNGNISGVKWRTRGRTAQAYGYTYDYLNRLTLADHSERNQANSGYLANKYNSTISYDQRGNLTTLNRTGKAFDGAGCLVEGEIDDLGYTYTGGSNRLVDITESANNSGNPDNAALIAAGYKGYSTTQTGADYLYDNNGNMVYDPSKNIMIHYNYLNLPERFEFEDCRVMEISYDAAGTKLKQVLRNGQREITTRVYAGGIEYNNGVLEAIYHPEGRTYFENGTNRQEFNLSDHLGNRRLTYSDLNGNGRIDMTTDPETNEVLDEKNYYAFGMEMAGDWLEDKGRASNYRFNGIEHNEELGLDLAFFRSYDPAIGRWMQVDPMAEAVPGMTPYRFGFNNPISFSDPSGLIEQNGGGDDPDKREIQYDEDGNPTGVRLGYSDSSTGATSYPLSAVGGIFSGIGTLFQQRASYSYSGGTLPQATVNATAPDHLWEINGDFMTQEAAFAMARSNFQMASRLLQEEFGTSTAIKFMAYDVNSAIYDFANSYVNPVLLSVTPLPILGGLGRASSLARGSASTVTGTVTNGFGAGLKAATGGTKQWFRLGSSYSHHLGTPTRLSLKWGAGANHWKKIENPSLQSFNRWFRQKRIPLPRKRFADPGHFHIIY